MTRRICIIDEHLARVKAWQSALAPQGEILHFSDPRIFMEDAAAILSAPQRLLCVITARYFSRDAIDLLHSPFAPAIKDLAGCPLFLNWPGPARLVHKHLYIDGAISQQFGTSLAALQLKVKRVNKKPLSVTDLSLSPSKERRCQQLFLHMAQKARGPHRSTLEKYAEHPGERGISLLEGVYRRLLSQGEIPPSCPSRYIHSSPMVALRYLKEVFAGASSGGAKP